MALIDPKEAIARAIREADSKAARKARGAANRIAHRAGRLGEEWNVFLRGAREIRYVWPGRYDWELLGGAPLPLVASGPLAALGTPKKYTWDGECIDGVRVDREAELSALVPKGELVLPFAALVDREARIDVELRVGERKLVRRQVRAGHWHHLRFENPGTQIAISATGPLVVGRPMPTRAPRTKPRLVLVLLFDSLSELTLARHGVEALIPNTARFLAGARRFTNAWVQAEWTVPCVASSFTGRYPFSHRLYQPHINRALPEAPILGEVFREGGFFTAGMSASWSTSPLFGFARGFDRFLYDIELSHPRIAHQAIETLARFEERPTLMVLNYNDLHQHDMLLPDLSICSETAVEVDEAALVLVGKSVHMGYSEYLAQRTVAKLIEIDRHLEALWAWIRSRYAEDEVVTVFTADHGSSYVGEEAGLLNAQMLRVPLLVKAPGLEGGTDDGFVEASVDLLPSLAKLAGLPPPECEGRVWAALGGERRDGVFAESLYKAGYEAMYRTAAGVVRLRCPLDQDEVPKLDDAEIRTEGAPDRERALDLIAAARGPRAHGELRPVDPAGCARSR